MSYAPTVPRNHDNLQVESAALLASRGLLGQIGFMSRTMSAAAAVVDFPGALEAVVGEGERVVIERSGMAVAAIVSLADLEALRRIEDEADLEAVRLAKAEGGDSIPYEQVRKELGLA